MHEPRRRRKHTWDIPGAVVFVTTVVYERQPIFRDIEHLHLLSETLHAVQVHHPLRMIAYAMMPDHIHLLMHLGPETHVSSLIHSLKRNFTREYKRLHGIAEPTILWQAEFLEHTIRDDDDLAEHIGYCHYNPIKHGLAQAYGEYPHTSYEAYP